MRLYCGILMTLPSDAWESFPLRGTLRLEKEVERVVVPVNIKNISTSSVRANG